MYQPRYQPQPRDSDWLENRSRRTKSEDFSRQNEGGGDETNLVEETLKEIRSRKSSDAAMSTVNKFDSRRLSCEEIDKVLNQIRSRSQSLSSRPPPPKASPPPLPNEGTDFDLRKTPFGDAASTSPPSRRPHSKQQQHHQQQHHHRSRPRVRGTASSGINEDISNIKTSNSINDDIHKATGSKYDEKETKNNERVNGRNLTEDEISRIIDSHKKKREHQDTTLSGDAKKRQSVTEDDIVRIIDAQKRQTKEQTKPCNEHRDVNDRKPAETFEHFDSDKVWHHNPAYDAPTSAYDASKSAKSFEPPHVDVDVDAKSKAAFETVRELNERLQSMSEDLSRVRAAADKINSDLQRETNSESDYENCSIPTHPGSKQNDKDKTAEEPIKQNYFRKINVTLSGKKSNEEKANHLPKSDHQTRDKSVPATSRKIPISKLNSPFTKFENPTVNETRNSSNKKFNPTTTSTNNNIRIRSKSAKPNVAEPTETNRVIITELSGDEGDEDNSSESQSEGGSPSVYKATVRATHVSRPKTETEPFRRKKVSLQKMGRPESIYIDPLPRDIDVGERLR